MTVPRPAIQSLIFEVTQRCNHACLHCYNVWQGPQPDGHPPYPRGECDTASTLALLGKALDECDCPHVTLTGGEPLLRPDLPRILEFLHARKVRVTVISNGRLLEKQEAEALIQRGAGLFELPLLSHRASMHDGLSGMPGSWDAVLRAISAVRLQRGQVVAAFVLTRQNAADLAETLQLAFAFGVRGVMLNRFNPGGRGRLHLEQLLPSIAQVREALETAEAFSIGHQLPISCSIPIQPCLIDTRDFPHIGFGYCAAGSPRAYYALDPLGNLRPCNHTDLILGNLFQSSFADLTTPERLSAFTCAIPAFCSACEKRLECQGGCKASAQVCYGALTVEEPFLRQAIVDA